MGGLLFRIPFMKRKGDTQRTKPLLKRKENGPGEIKAEQAAPPAAEAQDGRGGRKSTPSPPPPNPEPIATPPQRARSRASVRDAHAYAKDLPRLPRKTIRARKLSLPPAIARDRSRALAVPARR